MGANFTSAFAELAEHASDVPDFFGSLLLAFQRQENLTTNELMKFLGVRPQLFWRLAVCRRPRSDSPDFSKQIRAIADFTKTKPDMLLRVLRQVEALEPLAAHKNIVPINITGEIPAWDAHPGLLAAARDRESKRHARSPKKSPPLKQK